MLWGIALAGLCFALAWFNFLDPSIRKDVQAGTAPLAGESWESNAPVGSGEGCQPADFTLECYDGSEFHLADTRGKPVFINRWATWCTPCIEELPFFEALYQDHEGDIAMLVLHPNMTVTDPEAFLADFGLSMACATDGDGDPVKEILGGTTTLPQTIVLNRRGEVIYNSVKSVTGEILESLWQEASK